VSFELSGGRREAAVKSRRLPAACRLLPAALLLLFLPACRIGSGFDTAEKRRNLEWNEPVQVTQPEVTAPTPEVVATAKASPPIIYLLVAG